MKTTSNFAVAAVLVAIVTVTAASAQERKGPQSDQTMQKQDAMPGDMKGGDMSGMQDMMPMMKMMQQMGPMMEQCTKTMAALAEQMKSAPKGMDNNH